MEKPVVLFDGLCHLCDRSVQFILDHERDHLILFASLQSDSGKNILNKYKFTQNELKSIVFIEDGNAYTKSEAILFIARHLIRPWHFLFRLRIFPLFFRNAIYDFIARNRYRLFDKKEFS